MTSPKPAAYHHVELQEQALSADQRQKLQTLFKKFDKDNNGSLDKNELRALLEEALSRNLSDLLFSKYIELQFNASDKDYNGVIDFKEFVSLYSKVYLNPELPISMGTKHTGTKAALETGVGAPKVEKREISLSEEELQKARDKFNEFDADKSGYIDKQELKNLLKVTIGKHMGEGMVNRYVDSQFQMWDRDENGKIEFSEFIQLYAHLYNNKDAPGVPFPIMRGK